MGCREQREMEKWLKRTIDPMGEEWTDEKAKDRWAALRLLGNSEAVLDQCPQQADYWDLIFHAVLECCDLVKYNFIMFISAD